MIRPKISIVIPVYNTEKYIKKCLKSILEQTYDDYEIIIINDGSKDNSEKIIHKALKNCNNYIYLYQENKGLSEARNLGIQRAKGKYISFVDSDDWLEETFLEEMIIEAEKHDADLVQSGYFRKDSLNHLSSTVPKVNKTYYLDNERQYINCYYKTFIEEKYGVICCNKLYKKEIIDEVELKFQRNDEIYAEDLLFNIEYLVNSNKIIDIPVGLYNYRVRTGSITQTSKPLLEKRYAELMDRVDKIINDKLSIYNNEFLALAQYETLNVISINAYEEEHTYKSISNAIREYSKYNKKNIKNIEKTLKLLKNNITIDFKLFFLLLSMAKYFNKQNVLSFLFFLKIKVKS